MVLLTQNWSEDAEWLLTNRQGAAPDGDEYNSHLQLPLWQATLASASAPGYFKPEVIQYGKRSPRRVVLQDGGMTGFLNPAFRAFRFAALDGFRYDSGSSQETQSDASFAVACGALHAAVPRVPQFTYLRINPNLETESLRKLGF